MMSSSSASSQLQKQHNIWKNQKFINALIHDFYNELSIKLIDQIKHGKDTIST